MRGYYDIMFTKYGREQARGVLEEAATKKFKFVEYEKGFYYKHSKKPRVICFFRKVFGRNRLGVYNGDNDEPLSWQFLNWYVYMPIIGLVEVFEGLWYLALRLAK